MATSCDETCGWIAAFFAAISFGSYGVPMKGESSTRVDVDPLVFQSYKTFMVFVVSWLLVLAGAIQPNFTAWGIVSAIFWVPGGTAGIYAVRRAGLAISVGIWSSVIVFVSFVWGIVIFHENVRTVLGAASAAALLILGIWGISFYSSPSHQRVDVPVEEAQSGDPRRRLHQSIAEEGVSITMEETSLAGKIQANRESDNYDTLDVKHYPHSGAPPTSERVLSFFGVHITQYHLGLAMAVANGLLAATIMVPLHFAGANTRGLAYTVSFGNGAVIVTAFLWLVRFCYHAYNLGSMRAAYAILPSFHIRVMWRPGCISGLLYTAGNICGILSITALGDFMGYSLSQSSLIISGLWGIFYYREVQYMGDVVGWFVSAFVMLGGIVWLGYEHVR